MAAATSRRSSGPVLRTLPQGGRFSASTSSYYSAATTSPSYSPSTAFASSSSSSFAAHPSTFFHRSISPTRVNLVGPAAAPSVRFSIDSSRSVSPAGRPNHRQIARSAAPARQSPQPRRTCMCSPTTHPGSFRCALHKNATAHSASSHAFASPSNRLNARRSAMTNSLVRIGTVEGDLVKRALAALIRPSSHHQRRRSAFQPRPSRLSVMSRADDSDLA